ncbi:hypothetical protein OB920_15080 [Halobacteria archaeon HArc-gm2]|nr:hypothetical protein [Halobacteria archaeon HArc-gm2]
MARVLVDAENYRIEYDHESGALLHIWTEYTSGQEFRDGCNELLDVIKEENATKLIVDTSEIKAHDTEDKQWLQEEWMPREIEAGIEYSASVPSADSSISKMETEKLVDQATDLPMTYVMAESLAEAREWIADQ